jgi:hypothetical protein
MEASEFRTKTIAFYSPTSGAGTTTLAAFACIVAADATLDITGASLDAKRDLMRWLVNYQGIAWIDASTPSMARTIECEELVVFDVSSASRCMDVLRPDLWVMPISDRASYEAAAEIAPSLTGPILWVWNKIAYPGKCAESDSLREASVVPRHLVDRVMFAEDVIWDDFSISHFASECGMAESWMTDAARAAHRFCRRLLVRTEMIPPEFLGKPFCFRRGWRESEIEDETPEQAAAYPAAYAVREHDSREHLRTFFTT